MDAGMETPRSSGEGVAPMRRSLLPALVCALLIVTFAARADVSSSSIAFGTHGDPLRGASGAIVPLSSSSLLVPAEGPDQARGTADDEVLFVTGIGGTPTITALPVPFLGATGGGGDPTGGARMARLCATRAVIPTLVATMMAPTKRGSG